MILFNPDLGESAFLLFLSAKMNVIVHLEFEPACYNVTVQHGIHNYTRTSPVDLEYLFEN